jgi:hypothetical protein
MWPKPAQFPRTVNQVSGPDADACAGCRNVPSPGGGDFVANVFKLGQRFARLDRRSTRIRPVCHRFVNFP